MSPSPDLIDLLLYELNSDLSEIERIRIAEEIRKVLRDQTNISEVDIED